MLNCCNDWPSFSELGEAWPVAATGQQAETLVEGIAACLSVKYELVRTYVGVVAEVEVDRSSGEIRVPKFYVAHDCGQIINPDGLKNQLAQRLRGANCEPHADRGTEIQPVASN